MRQSEEDSKELTPVVTAALPNEKSPFYFDSDASRPGENEPTFLYEPAPPSQKKIQQQVGLNYINYKPSGRYSLSKG